jgi:alpha-1,6-mannosyltransferase
LPLARAPLPPNDRTGAELTVLDITKWFGETSGGVRTYLTAKARYVAARRDLRHVLVVPGPFDGLAMGDGVRTYRVRGPLIPTQTAYRFLLATRTTRRLMEHERPDLVEVGSPFAVPWVAALATRRLGTPMVSFHHSNLAAVGESAGMRRPAARAWVRLTAAYLRRLNTLFRTTIVASDFAAGELHAMGIDRVTRVPLGVDLEHFHPRRREERQRVRRRLGLPLDRPLVLFVGRLAREKRLDVALAAWPEVSRRTGAHLAIVGAGSEGESLRRMGETPQVSWLPFQGDRDQVARLHAAADLYLSPGDRETFGLSALEAMASGIPVVSAARGGGWELVQRSGAGAGYEPGSPNDLARAVAQLLGGDLSAEGARARAFAEREHGWDAVFDRLFAVYREVLRR